MPQSVEPRYPFVVAVATGIEIVGVVPPVDKIGAVAVIEVR